MRTYLNYLESKVMSVVRKKNAAFILVILIVSVAIAIVVITSIALTPTPPRPLQPNSGQIANLNEAQNTLVSSNDSGSQTAVNLPTTIDVASTTTAFPFVQRWAAQYENQQLASADKINIVYLEERQIGEANGSDVSQLAIVGIPHGNNALYIPVSAQAVALVYNIPGFPDIPSGLKLNSSTLFLMLNGSITQWNDDAIKDLNPSLNLPAERIIVVHASNNSNKDSSSSFALLNQYLGSQSINWSNDSIPVLGPAELAEKVRTTPYSLGYVDFSYAVQTRMTYAEVNGADGDFIIPSTHSIGLAVDNALQFHNSSTDQSSSQQQPPSINASRLVNGSYPITGLYYAAFAPARDDEKRTALAVSFVNWTISEDGGQQALLEVQYPPIYLGNEQLTTYAQTMLDAFSNKLMS